MSINSYLIETASKLIISDNEKATINNHINALQNKLIAYFNNSEILEHFSFGSFTRNTLMPRRANDRSDVDYMIVFRDGSFSPQTYLRWLREFAESRYVRSDIYQSFPTIVLELSRIKIELVPALKNSYDNYQIPAPSGDFNNWLVTHPNSFNTSLTTKNSAEKGLIRPLIRLMKYWNAQNGYVYSNYELENLIVNRSYLFCNNLWNYFYSFSTNLFTYNLNVTKAQKVDRLKEICKRAHGFELDGRPIAAEEEIKKIIPVY